MTRRTLLASLLLAFAGAQSVAADIEDHTFIWGVGGHPNSKQALWNDAPAQFATLAHRGFKSYRFDVALTADTHQSTTYLQSLVALARKHGITLHPVLYMPLHWDQHASDGGKYPDTPTGLEAQGYDYVYPIALQFAGQIHDWELENELTLRPGLKSGSGRSADDYATPQAQRWAAVLRGMAKAIREARHKTGEPLRTVVDIVYVDFGFVPFLEAQGVAIDKLAYHYYYGAETSPYKIFAPDGTTVNLFAEFRRMGKPVIINEFNAGEIYAPRQGKMYDDAKALTSLKTHIAHLLGQSEAHIEGAEFYELYDEPWKDAVESNFGLMKDATHPKTQMLLAAAYACGELTSQEQAALEANKLFSKGELSMRRNACRERNRR